jgi:hypothetical protein
MSGAGAMAACSDVSRDANEAKADRGVWVRPAGIEGRLGEVEPLRGSVTHDHDWKVDSPTRTTLSPTCWIDACLVIAGADVTWIPTITL